MKNLLSLIFSSLCSLALAQPFTFQGCDSLPCHQQKYVQLMQAVEKAIYEYSDFQYNDSISLTLRYQNGELILENSYAWVNADAPQYYFEALKNELTGFGASADSLVTVNWVQSVNQNYKDFPKIDCNTNLPTPHPCKDYNKQGQQGCWRYLTFKQGKDFSEKNNFADFMGADLFYKKGRLIAVDFFDPPLHQKKAVAYIKAVAAIDSHFFTTGELNQADSYRYRIDPYAHGDRDSADQVQHLTQHLDFYVKNQLWHQFHKLMKARNYYGKIDTARSREALRMYHYLENAHQKGLLKEKWWEPTDTTPTDSIPTVNYQKAETVPVFKGCDPGDSNEDLRKCFQNELMNLVAKTYQYPEEARKKGISGRIYVNFIIEKTGEICNIEVVKSTHPLLDMECIRVVSEIPRCEQPAFLRDEPVRLSFTLPINMKLQ